MTVHPPSSRSRRTTASRLRRPAAAFASFGLIAGLVAATPGTAQAASGQDESRTAARAATGWSTIASAVDFGTTPTTARRSGALHVAYRGGDKTLNHLRLDSAGRTVQRSQAVHSWASTTRDPVLLSRPGGALTMTFSGQRTTTTGAAYSSGHMYSTTSLDGGLTWNLDDTVGGPSPTAYAGNGAGATTLTDGTPVVAWARHDMVHLSTSPVPLANVDTAPSQGFAATSCCVYDVGVTRDRSAVYASWYQNGNTAATRGVMVRQVHPSLGGTRKAPGTTRSFGRAAMTSRAQGGTFVAYCVGAGTPCASIVLWRVDTNTYLTVPGSTHGYGAAIASTPDGRIWVTWRKGDRVYAARTNPQATRFGAVVDAGKPGGSGNVSVDGASGRADIILVAGTALRHRQVLPGLTVTTSPGKVKLRKRSTVTFKVLDAGVAVKGAKVRALGKTCTTNSRGICKVKFKGKRLNKKITASRSGYVAARSTIKYRK